MSWNAFEGGQPDEIKQSERLGEICRDEILFRNDPIVCRKIHRQGEVEHEAFYNDDSGMRTIRITWR